jgi:protein-S-isoprenylcysteine O-methyltransferase Ste14
MVGPLLTLLAVAVYGALHSVLAAPAAKALARQALGASADRYYRVTYNLIAAVTFVPVLAVVALAPGRVLFRVPSPWWIIAVVGQAAGLILVVAGLLETDVWHFLGLRQLSAPQPDAHSPLIVTGLYRWVRHPLYAAGLAVLWLSPIMTTSLLAFNATLTVYILIGYRLEERRLSDAFGPAYEDYRRLVPALLPLPGRAFIPPHDE